MVLPALPIAAMAAQAKLSEMPAVNLRSVTGTSHAMETVGRFDTPPVNAADVELRRAVSDFEAVFITMMWKQLRETVPKGGLLGDTLSTEMFQTMLDEKMSVEMAKAGGIGLARVMYRQLAPQVLGATPKPGKLV